MASEAQPGSKAALDEPPEEAALLKRWERTSAELVDARSVADAIGSALSAAIIERELPAAWPLREERLASLFGVSRTPIREALAGLANAGLARRDNRGSLRVRGVTAGQILDVYAVRRRLEGLSAALAAEAATPRQIAYLKHLNRTCEEAVAAGDVKRLAEANIEFHAAMARSTGNELLIQFIEDVQTWVKRIPTTTLSYPGRSEGALDEHAKIIEAIEARDAERADQLARDHMGVAEEIRMRMLREDPDADLAERLSAD
jgi:DNA-binding GntR family transcriptional regulator